MSKYLTNKHHQSKAALRDKAERANTARAIEQDLRYFWTWARIVYDEQEPIYPTPLDLLQAFVIEHVDNTLDEDVRDALKAEGFLRTKREVDGKPGLCLRTIKRRVYSISRKHRELNIDDGLNPALHPSVAEVLRDGRAKEGHAPQQKQPLTRDKIVRLYDACEVKPGQLQGLRDRALIALTYDSGGRRRSETVQVRVEDLRRDDAQDGVGFRFLLRLGTTKTRDAAEQGFDFSIEGSAALFVQDWIDASGIRSGYLFPGIRNDGRFVLDAHTGKPKPMSTQTFYAIVKKLCQRAGLAHEDFSPHSIRAGFVTDGLIAGKSAAELMAATDHATEAAFNTYYRMSAAQRRRGSQLDEEQ